MVPNISTTILSLLKHHPSAKSRWAHITRLLINTPFTPLHFSLLFLSLKTSPFLAFSLFNLSLSKNLINHTLLSYTSIIHVLARSRVLKNQTLTLIRKALIAFPNQTFEFFEILTRSYRRFDSGPMVYDLLVEGVLRSRKVDVCVEIARVLVTRGFLTVKTRNKVVKAVCESNGSFVGYRLFREMFYFSDFRRNSKNDKNVDVRENLKNTKNLDICGDFKENLKNMKNLDICGDFKENLKNMKNLDICGDFKENLKNIDGIGVFMENVKNIDICNENEEIFVKERSLTREHSVANSYVYDYVGNNVQNVCSLKKNDNDMKERFVCSHVDKVRPNVSSYNVLLLAFYRDGMTNSLEGIWAEMTKRGILPNVYCYNILLRAYCEDENMKEAEKVWEEMEAKGLKRDEVAYEIMIDGYCSIGKVSRAEDFFREMEMSGIKGSCASFEHLIKGYCEIGDLGSALLLYKDMCRRGFSPEGPVVDVVVQGFCRENRVYQGLEFLRVAMKKYEIVPRWKSYEVLMKGLCEEGIMDEALKLQAEMVGKGFEPNSEIYNVFIDGYTKQGNDEMAKRMKKEMVDTQMTN